MIEQYAREIAIPSPPPLQLICFAGTPSCHMLICEYCTAQIFTGKIQVGFSSTDSRYRYKAVRYRKHKSCRVQGSGPLQQHRSFSKLFCMMYAASLDYKKYSAALEASQDRMPALQALTVPHTSSCRAPRLLLSAVREEGLQLVLYMTLPSAVAQLRHAL